MWKHIKSQVWRRWISRWWDLLFPSGVLGYQQRQTKLGCVQLASLLSSFWWQFPWNVLVISNIEIQHDLNRMNMFLTLLISKGVRRVGLFSRTYFINSATYHYFTGNFEKTTFADTVSLAFFWTFALDTLCTQILQEKAFIKISNSNPEIQCFIEK